MELLIYKKMIENLHGIFIFRFSLFFPSFNNIIKDIYEELCPLSR